MFCYTSAQCRDFHKVTLERNSQEVILQPCEKEHMTKAAKRFSHEHLINTQDLEALAADQLDKTIFDYYAGGAGDELTLNDNAEAFNRIRLRPRMLVDISNLDMSVELFGSRIDMPIMVAPTAFQRLAHPDGEVAMAKAAARHNTIMVLSTLATSSLEEVAESSTGPLWFQLYVYKDKEITVDLMTRAEKAGYKADLGQTTGLKYAHLEHVHLPETGPFRCISRAEIDVPFKPGCMPLLEFGWLCGIN